LATKSPGPAGPSKPAPDAAPRLSLGRWLILALLAAATFAVFAGVLRNGWTLLDDPQYVLDNPHVNRGWRLDDALWFLSHSHGGNWHPLTSWSHMLDVQLFGLAPAGPHAVNLTLHVVNAVLLAWVLFRMTGAWWRSLMVAALFAFHPLRVESVAWISERKDVLSGLSFLLTIEAYRRWAVRPDRARHAVLLVAFALGLMSKPMLVTLPFVLVLVDVWPLGRLRGMTRRPGLRAPALPLMGLIAEKWPLFALSGASAVITFFVQRGSGAVASVGLASPARRITNALVSCWRYVEKTLWPQDLAVFYPYSNVIEYAAAATAAAGLVAVTALFLWQARRRSYLLVGWLWYLGMLVPVIGLIQVGGQAYADRYTYLTTIGLIVALVWFAGELAARWRPGRAVAVAVFSLALAGLSGATVRQVACWKDARTLFEHTLAVTRDNPIAHLCLGDVSFQAGDAELAMRHYQAASRLAPGWGEPRNKLGGAIVAALASVPVQQVARWRDPQVSFERALAIIRDDPAVNEKVGELLLLEGRPQLAIEHFEEVLQARPDFADTRRLLAETLARAGRAEDAIRAYRELLRRSPDDLDALNNLAWIFATHADPARRDGAEAVRLAERAGDRSPEPVAVFYSTLGAAYAEAGRFPEAVSAGTRAVELARGEGRADEIQRFEEQLRGYRVGKAFHFAK